MRERSARGIERRKEKERERAEREARLLDARSRLHSLSPFCMRTHTQRDASGAREMQRMPMTQTHMSSPMTFASLSLTPSIACNQPHGSFHSLTHSHSRSLTRGLSLLLLLLMSWRRRLLLLLQLREGVSEMPESDGNCIWAAAALRLWLHARLPLSLLDSSCMIPGSFLSRCDRVIDCR